MRVEVLNDEHFIMSVGGPILFGESYAPLRPSPYLYQLSDKCKLFIGDVECRYHIASRGIRPSISASSAVLNDTALECAPTQLSAVSDAWATTQPTQVHMYEPSQRIMSSYPLTMDSQPTRRDELLSPELICTTPIPTRPTSRHKLRSAVGLTSSASPLSEYTSDMDDTVHDMKRSSSLLLFLSPQEEQETQRKRQRLLRANTYSEGEIPKRYKTRTISRTMTEFDDDYMTSSPPITLTRTLTRTRSNASTVRTTRSTRTLDMHTEEEVGGSYPAIALTGLDQGESDHLALLVRRLGGCIVESSQQCTHLIARKVIRTKKFLCAVLQGKPILTPDWITSSNRAGYFVDMDETFHLSDTESESKFGFSLNKTLAHASNPSELPLLEGYRILLSPNVKPLEDIEEIIDAAGGTVAQPNQTRKSKCFIIGTEVDSAWCIQHASKKQLSCYSTEMLFSAILTHRLDLGNHLLNFL